MANPNEKIVPGCKVMSKDGFWNLIAEVKAACGQDQEKYMDTLIARLLLSDEAVKMSIAYRKAAVYPKRDL